jgi:3-oxoacyl-[acyl-carrier protein] reductase
LTDPTFAERILGLRGKVAIVTGASRGIGAAVVSSLTQLEVDVVGVSRGFDSAWSEKVGNGRAVELKADVRAAEAAEEAVKLARERFGRLDILVNNAGTLVGGTILDYDREDWEKVLRVNIDGFLNFARAAALDMVAHKTQGRIVNVASTAGLSGEAGLMAYGTTKGAVLAMTKSLAVDLAPHGITANSIAPGWTDTQMGTGSLNQKQREAVNNAIPLGHIASPDEIAGAIVFLASDLSRYMTGGILVVDGGHTSDITVPGIEY